MVNQVANNLDTEYKKLIDVFFNDSKFKSNGLSSPFILGALIYQKMQICASICIKQIKCEAEINKIIKTLKDVSHIKFPILLDLRQLPIEHQTRFASLAMNQNNHPQHSSTKIFNGTELREKLTPYELTLLHLAVISGNQQLTLEILETGLADPDARDKCGWTPMHHAALKGDIVMMKLLEQHGANPKIVNNRDGTPEDILRLSGKKGMDPQQPLPLLLNEKGVQTPINSLDFKKMMGVEYLDDYVMDPSVLLSRWNKDSRGIHHIIESYLNQEIFKKLQLDKAFEAYRKNPPKLLLEKTEGAGWIVRAGEAIKRGQIATEYLGHVLKEGEKVLDTEYFLDNSGEDDISSVNERNAGPIISDGFPNVAGLWGKGKGFVNRSLMIMLEDVKPGDILCCDYGAGHDVKVNTPHLEFREEAFIDYFKTNSLPKLCREAKECKLKLFELSDNEFIEKIKAKEKLGYLCNTPSSLFILICKGIIKLDDFKLMLETKEFQSLGIISNELYKGYTVQILPIYSDYLQEIDRLKAKDPKLASKTHQACMKASATMSLLQLLAKLQGVVAYLKTNPAS